MPDQTENPFPLNIVEKQDSWERQQLLENISDIFKLPAAEFNKIVTALNYLYANSGDGSAGDFSLGNVPVKFKSVVIDYAAPGTTTTKVINKINQDPNYILDPGTLYVFYVNRIVLTNGVGIGVAVTPENPNPPSYAIIQELFILSQKITPNADGVLSLGVGGTVLQSNGVRFFNTIDNRSLAPTQFDLGNIGAIDVSDAINPSGPFSTPNGVSVIFRAIQNGEEKLWLYFGLHEEIGNSFPDVDENDFRLFPDAENADPLPAYQESLPFEIEDLGDSRIPLNHHEGALINQGSAHTGDIFKVSGKELGGKAMMLISTADKEQFPIVQETDNNVQPILIKPIQFEADKEYQLYITYNGVVVHYWFESFEAIVAAPVEFEGYSESGTENAFNLEAIVGWHNFGARIIFDGMATCHGLFEFLGNVVHQGRVTFNDIVNFNAASFFLAYAKFQQGSGFFGLVDYFRSVLEIDNAEETSVVNKRWVQAKVNKGYFMSEDLFLDDGYINTFTDAPNVQFNCKAGVAYKIEVNGLFNNVETGDGMAYGFRLSSGTGEINGLAKTITTTNEAASHQAKPITEVSDDNSSDRSLTRRTAFSQTGALYPFEGSFIFRCLTDGVFHLTLASESAANGGTFKAGTGIIVNEIN